MGKKRIKTSSVEKQDMKPLNILQAAVGSELKYETEAYTELDMALTQNGTKQARLFSISTHAGLEGEMSTFVVPKSTGQVSREPVFALQHL